jgi:single-strand DNA-binding protein
MAGYNKAILVGNLGADPQIRNLENGVKLATFNIATTETYIDRDNNRQEKTEWHRIVAWRGLAELSERYLKKGSKVFIEGKITTRTYEQDGITRSITEIVAANLVLMSSGSGGGGYMNVPPPSEEYSTRTAVGTSYSPSGGSERSAQSLSSDDKEPIIGDPTDDLPF